jgi:DNA polymerase III epsilon subunit-like protein
MSNNNIIINSNIQTNININNNIQSNKNNKIYVFYDLETNGLDYYTTGIMQITILDIDGNILLDQYSYPFNNKIDGTHIHGIDLNKLVENNAINNIELCIKIKNIIRENYNRNDVYFIAYNNFGYDQIILENNFKIANIKIPNNWFFIDLLPIVKELYKIKPNYKLKTVYEYLCGIDDTINYHSSLSDTICLYKIYNHMMKDNNNFNMLLIKYCRSLLQYEFVLKSPISSLYGYTDGMMFHAKSINIIEDIYNIYKEYNYDINKLSLFLKSKLNIYSDYYNNNLCRQIAVIHYLLKN